MFDMLEEEYCVTRKFLSKKGIKFSGYAQNIHKILHFFEGSIYKRQNSTYLSLQKCGIKCSVNYYNFECRLLLMLNTSKVGISSSLEKKKA